MGDFAEAMDQRKTQSLGKKEGIKRAFDLHDKYTDGVEDWHKKQAKRGTQNLLWKLIENLVAQSRTSKWKQKDLPKTSKLRSALGIEGDEDKKIEEIVASNQGHSDAKFVSWGRKIDKERRKLEVKANRLRNYVLYGSADIEKASKAKELSKQPFFTAFRDLDYKNQLRVACRITEGLSHTLIGKQLLADLLFYAPFKFLDFFDYPAHDLPDYTSPVSDEKRTVIKPLKDGDILQSGSPGKLKKQFNPTVDNLLQLARQLMPGIAHRLVREHDDSTAQSESLEALGTIFYLFFDSANVFDKQTLQQHLPSASHDSVFEDLASGGIPWSKVGGLAPAYVGKSEKVISTISEETEWAEAGNAVQRRAVALKGVFAIGGAVIHVSNTVDKYNKGNYQWTTFGQNVVTLGKTVVDSTAVARKVFRVTVSELTDKVLGVVGILGDIYDTGMTIYKAVKAYQRGDISVAAGYGVASLGAMGGIAATAAFMLGTSNPVGWTIAGITSVALFIGGVSFASLTGDPLLVKWIKRTVFGINYGKKDSPKPSAFYYDYTDDEAGDPMTADARMTGTYYGFQADETVASVEIFDRQNDSKPSQLKITLDNVVALSATDVFVQPIVNKGDGKYETGQFQHVIHLSDMAHVSNTSHPPPLDTKVGLANELASPNSPATVVINVWEDLNANSFSIEDLLGIDRATFDGNKEDIPAAGHYLEVGIIPSSLKDTESNSLGTQVKANTIAQYSRAYNRSPIMIRNRTEISLK